jgi:hypothetical protein
MLAAGRSMAKKVEAVLQKFLAPAPDNWGPPVIRIYVSAELSLDMKDLKFGWGNENTYGTCHRRILPFTVLQVSMEQQDKCRKVQKCADGATHLSTDVVQSMEADLGCCPGSYYNMLSLIWHYIRMLTGLLFGAGCVYLIEVQGVFQVFADKSTVYELMTGELVAETLRQIFIDAPVCLLQHHTTSSATVTVALPLAWIHSELHAQGNHQLPGGPVAWTTARVNSSIPTVQCWGILWKSLEQRWINNVYTIGPISRIEQAPPPQFVEGRRKNPKPVFEIVNIMKVFRDSHPNVDMSDLMRSQKLTMAMLRWRAIKQ